MQDSSPADRETLELVEVIDFKWLMANEGLHVHVERLQSDGAYARDCLAKAANSPREAVREVARRLGHKLGLAGT